MTPKERATHFAHEDERNRRAALRKLEEHELVIMERARRRVLATLVNPEPVEDPDFPGCVW